MCSAKMPGAPPPVASAPPPPIPTAQIMKPGRARQSKNSGTDVLSALRIPIQSTVPGISSAN